MAIETEKKNPSKTYLHVNAQSPDTDARTCIFNHKKTRRVEAWQTHSNLLPGSLLPVIILGWGENSSDLAVVVHMIGEQQDRRASRGMLALIFWDT